MEFVWVRKNRGTLSFYVLQDVKRERAVALVTLRTGGFSVGAYEGLNLSLRVGDDPSLVRMNRQLLTSTLGLSEENCAWPEQVHGESVLYAETPGAFREADGLVSSRPGLWMAVLVADCVPVFVLDDRLSVVGLAHAGRRGTALGITKNLVNLVRSRSGVPGHRLIAALGPSIGLCCYELDRKTAYELPGECVTERNGRTFVDLWEANTLQALGEGIPRDNVLLPPACTCCEPQMFFSHRAHRGSTGRQMAVTTPEGFKPPEET